MVIMKTNSIFKKLALAFCALAMFATQSYYKKVKCGKI